MKVTYTGVHHDLPPKVQAKLDAKFTKLSKLLDGRGEHKAHVIVSQQKKNVKAEVTVQFYDHQFVGAGTDGDLFNALSGALMKLEAQAVKHKAKWRDTHRRDGVAPQRVAKAIPEPPAKKTGVVYRIDGTGRKKPMTIEEAIIEIGKDGPYLVYRDADSDRLAVLIRRDDGNFDLIET